MLWFSIIMLRYTYSTSHRPKTRFARSLRKRQTPGEKLLWRQLRARNFHGLKFRRQVPVGPYIVDFLCVQRKLIIEIDGDSHCALSAQERDKKREEYLRNKGFVVIRFSEQQVKEDIHSVLTQLGKRLSLYQN